MSRPSLDPGRSPALRLVAVLVGLEGCLLGAIAGFYVVEVVVGSPSDVVAALVSAGLALVAGVGLLLVARGLAAGRRWSRAPALVTNLILLPVAIGLFQGGRWYVGAPLLAVAGPVVALLFSRGVSDALEQTGAAGQL